MHLSMSQRGAATSQIAEQYQAPCPDGCTIGRNLARFEHFTKYCPLIPRLSVYHTEYCSAARVKYLNEKVDRSKPSNVPLVPDARISDVVRFCIGRRINYSPPSSTMHGAPRATEQSCWLLRTPLTQQSVLSRPAAAPKLPHFEPPHLVHARGQQAMPLSFSPSKPANPLLHSETGSVTVLW